MARRIVYGGKLKQARETEREVRKQKGETEKNKNKKTTEQTNESPLPRPISGGRLKACWVRMFVLPELTFN